MMENKFTPRAEESLRLAQEAAEEMGHGYVGSEHLLLALLENDNGTGVLAGLGVNAAAVESFLDADAGRPAESA